METKKKIALISIFDNPNFGTYLQVFALSSVLERFGNEVTIIHYERLHWQYLNSLLESFKGVNFLHKISRTLNSILPYIQKKKEQQFIKRYFNVTKKINSYQELEKNIPIADIYLTGSDQVWNSTHNRGVDRAFYLAFAPSDKKKCAYAASIGMDNIPVSEQYEVSELLKRYNSISVREVSNIKLLNDIGIDNVKLVLDPTLLLKKEDWLKYVKPQKREKYLLVYSVESAEQNIIISKIAKQIAQARNLKIYGVYYTGYKYRLPNCDRNFYYSTPEKFLSLIANASFVVVSSFHGTAFSINLNKEFITVTPKRFSSRIDSLLSMLDLNERKITSFEQFDIKSVKDIDYINVNKKLSLLRENSYKYIQTQILG